MLRQFVEIGEMMQTPPKWFDKSCKSGFVIIKHREYNSAASDNFKKNAFSYPTFLPVMSTHGLILRESSVVYFCFLGERIYVPEERENHPPILWSLIGLLVTI